MASVELEFKLAHPVDEALAARLAELHGIYGLHHARLATSGDRITVDYDASRLTPNQVRRALLRAGIPVIA